MNPYAAVVALRNRLYDSGTLKARKLGWPVISVGNLRVGGAGKTPFVIHLGELLQARKIAFDVLSRGYGRKDTTVRLVEAEGSARVFGDEPLLIARKLHVPVVVGADRYAAGQLAEKMFAALKPAHGGPWLHLLDDGFQHRKLARDFDIVLLTDSDGDDRLLPFGRLREPLRSLQRADAIVVPEPFDVARLPEFARAKPIWRMRRSLELPAGVPKRVFAFAGIARPDPFFADLKAAGLELEGEMKFDDHHRYDLADAHWLQENLRIEEADAFITTEKDLINLGSEGLKGELNPLLVARLRVELLEPGKALDAISKLIADR